MVKIGEEYLARGSLDKAIQTFQEAINVDFENGVAYYFMAKALFLAEVYEDALGLLDRAESLLRGYPEWLKEVIRLRLFVKEARENQIQMKNTEKGGYY